jgi:hypothetical protein
MRRSLVCVGVAILAGILAAHAAADDWSACKGSTREEAIAACNRLIASGALKGGDLARAIYDRGRAYVFKGELDHAIVDYAEAVQLDPNNAFAFDSRGLTKSAERRVALVIGNSNYRNAGPLANPTNDARLMAATLLSVGFTLSGGRPQLDLDRSTLERVVRDFGRDLQGADVGLFFYAGHGIRVDGVNYLVPVDANPTKKGDLDFEMLDADVVVRNMNRGAKLSIVILDACRNNPFAGGGLREVAPGLAEMSPPENVFISFATRAGRAAQDGDVNSPYTKALTAAMVRKPALGLWDTFNSVGRAVIDATDGNQQPWTSNSPIDRDFYFTEPPMPLLAADEIAWKSLIGTTDAAALRRFLSDYPASKYRGEATARITMLESDAPSMPQAVVGQTVNASTAPAADAPSGAMKFAVQVGAQRTETGAREIFRVLQAKYSVLADRQPLIARKDLGPRGVFYAVLLPFKLKIEADALCESLKSASGACFVSPAPD